jgi:hypothetical protein
MSATPTAGPLLQQALHTVGIDSHFDGHPTAGCFWLVVEATPGEIWIDSANRKTDHAPADHPGWVACHYPDLETGEFTLIYATGICDFTADTEAVVQAVRRYLADPAPWTTDPRLHATSGPYLTAGEHLRRALAESGIDTYIGLEGGRFGAHVAATVPWAKAGTLEITGLDGSLDRPLPEHPGWVLAYRRNHTETGLSEVSRAVTGDPDTDISATVEAVRAFLADWPDSAAAVSLTPAATS